MLWSFPITNNFFFLSDGSKILTICTFPNESNSSLILESTTPNLLAKTSFNSPILALVITVPFSNTTFLPSVISSAKVWFNKRSLTFNLRLNL